MNFWVLESVFYIWFRQYFWDVKTEENSGDSQLLCIYYYFSISSKIVFHVPFLPLNTIISFMGTCRLLFIYIFNSCFPCPYSYLNYYNFISGANDSLMWNEECSFLMFVLLWTLLEINRQISRNKTKWLYINCPMSFEITNREQLQ